jgi:RAD51-like protein 2
MQLACDVQIPEAFSGCGGQAIYIDTEGSFVPRRVHEIANALVDHMKRAAEREHRPDLIEAAACVTTKSVMQNIFYFRVYDYVEQLSCVKSLPKFLRAHPNVRLIVIDSIAFHFRRDFDDMALRARMLTGHAQDLLELAEQSDLAVVLTNQVTTKINNVTKASQLVPALGESWAHACTNRIMLNWRGEERWAQLIKSPSQRGSAAPFCVTSAGFRGVRSKRRKHSSSAPAAAAAVAPSSSSSSSSSSSAAAAPSSAAVSSTAAADVHMR